MKTIINLLIALLLANGAIAQARFHPDKSKMTLEGTSSLHDWESVVEVERMKVELDVETADPLLLGHLKLDIPVRSIKSGKNIMDKKTYAALKCDDYPTITYEVAVLQCDNGEVIASDGLLHVAGEKKTVPVVALYKRASSTGLTTFEGSVSFKMTDFNIKPPTAIMGTLKTGDEITINYNLALEINQ